MQLPAVALMHSPLKRLVVPVLVILTLASMAGFFDYFVVAPAPDFSICNPCSTSGNGGPFVDRGTSAVSRYGRRCLSIATVR
jgi:hypothetical protein